MASPAQKKANKKYNREKMVGITFRLNRQSDAELIEKFRQIRNKTQWFRKALKEVSE